jgi:hypothetical protein
MSPDPDPSRSRSDAAKVRVHALWDGLASQRWLIWTAAVIAPVATAVVRPRPSR